MFSNPSILALSFTKNVCLLDKSPTTIYFFLALLIFDYIGNFLKILHPFSMPFFELVLTLQIFK